MSEWQLIVIATKLLKHLHVSSNLMTVETLIFSRLNACLRHKYYLSLLLYFVLGRLLHQLQDIQVIFLSLFFRVASLGLGQSYDWSSTCAIMTSSNGNISVVLALCEGNPLVCLHKGPVTQVVLMFFYVSLNKQLRKQSSDGNLICHDRHCYVTVMGFVKEF